MQSLETNIIAKIRDLILLLLDVLDNVMIIKSYNCGAICDFGKDTNFT